MAARRGAFLRIALIATIAAMLLAMGASSASASHFRSGNLSWAKASGGPGTVTFQNTQAWRRSSQFGSGSDGNPVVGDVIDTGEGCISPGDSGSSFVCPMYLVTESHPNEDWIVVRALADPNSTSNFDVPFDYGIAGSFTAVTESCCTISELSNANDSSWNVKTVLNTFSDTQSPRSTASPIVTMPSESGIQTFQIPHTYNGNGTVKYRLANASESCVDECTDPQPPSFTVDENTGQASFDTTGHAGLWWAGVVLEAWTTGSEPEVISSSQVQFILRVGGPPQWTGLTPADGAVYTVSPGDTVSFDLTAADPDPNDTVTISQSNGPGSLSPTDGNPANAHYTFTASDADLNQEYTATFEATEVSPIPRVADPRNVTIRVVPRQLPPPPPPPPGVGEPTLGVNGNFQPKSGQVFVKLPAGATAKPKYRWARKAAAHAAQAPKGFVPLSTVRQLPVGSVLDTRKGVVGVTVAANATSSQTQSADFSKGLFRFNQAKKNPMTTMTMTGKLKCKGKVPKGGAKKVTAARRRSRSLFGSGRGRFRTRGRNSSATVRGTQWLTKDTCAGTLTSVKEGTVKVRDFVKKKNVTVKQGKKYFARAPKARGKGGKRLGG
jgi:hypothetical protein